MSVNQSIRISARYTHAFVLINEIRISFRGFREELFLLSRFPRSDRTIKFTRKDEQIGVGFTCGFRPCTLHPSWFVVHGWWFVIRDSWFVLRGWLFVVRGSWFVVELFGCVVYQSCRGRCCSCPGTCPRLDLSLLLIVQSAQATQWVGV